MPEVHNIAGHHRCRQRTLRLFTLLPCSLLLSAQPGTPANAPKPAPALVTFVDNGMSLLGGFPGQKSQAFRGKLFVEDKLLATMEPGHFVTFTFDPGDVNFTAQTWMATGPRGGAHITLNLQPGKHYFVELRTKQACPQLRCSASRRSTAIKPEKTISTINRWTART